MKQQSEELLNFGGPKKKGNMQKNFLSFMKKRQNRRKHAKYLKKTAKAKRRSPEFKEELR